MVGHVNHKTYNVLISTKSEIGQFLNTRFEAIADIEDIFVCNDLPSALQCATEKEIDIVIIDFFIRNGTALDFLQHFHLTKKRQCTIIVLVDDSAFTMSLCAYRKGANQVLVKDPAKNYVANLEKIVSRICHLNQHGLYTPCSRIDINHAMIGIDTEGDIQFLNSCAAGYLGKPLPQLINHSIYSVFKGIDKNLLGMMKDSIHLSKMTLQPQPIGSVRIANLEHELAKVELMAYPILQGENELNGFIISMQEGIQANNLGYLSDKGQIYDPLTGALSREAFLNKLNHTLLYSSRYEQQCAILHIDVDGFKALNDSFGHTVADELLKLITQRLNGMTREVDIISRIGADEFYLLLSHISYPQDAARVADKIMKAFKKPINYQGKQFFITVSIGIAIFPHDSQNLENLLQCANTALTNVKSIGKNDYQFYKFQTNKEATNTVEIANDLRLALKNEQLELHFQPQVTVGDYKHFGFEALIRWNHPELGMISPALFIPIAEQMGLICDVGHWVIEKACQSVLLFQEQGYSDFVMGINLSVKQFMRDEFIQEVKQCINFYGIDPERIEFEITESIFAHNTAEIIEKINVLKSLGFHLVMDDFGTGYSCLSYLKDLPLDGIKIDQAFVQSIQGVDQKKYIAIVSAIITLAQQLEIKTLAEGIEDTEQAEYLAKLGCDYLQGYLFSKPLPIEECFKYLESHVKAQNNSKAG